MRSAAKTIGNSKSKRSQKKYAFIAANVASFALISILLPYLSHADATTRPDLHKAYKLYCERKFDHSSALTAGVLEKNPADVEARLFRLHISHPSHVHATPAPDQKIETMSHLDRVEEVERLMLDNSGDVERLRALLAFETTDVSLQKHRLLSEASVDFIAGKKSEAFEKAYAIFEGSKSFDAELLGFLMEIGVENPAARDRLWSQREKVMALADDQPIKHTILAYLKILESGWEPLNVVADLMKKAYELCPVDRRLSIDYANFLNALGDHPTARRIAEATIAEHRYYSPVFDFILADVYLSEGLHKKAYAHFSRAKAAAHVFDSRERLRLQSLEQAFESRQQTIVLVGLVLILSGALGMALFALRWKRK